MPLPTQIYLPQIAGSKCMTVTLREMCEAWDAAGDDQKARWVNTTVDDPWGVFWLYDAFYNLGAQEDTDTIKTITLVLEQAKWFYSPDNPPPPPPPIELVDMIAAFERASADDQQTFANLIAGQITNNNGGGGITSGDIAALLADAPNQNLNAILSDFGVTVAEPNDPPATNLAVFIQSLNETNQVVTVPLLPTLIENLCIEWGARFVFGKGDNSIDVVLNPVTKCLEVVGVIYLGGSGGLDDATTNRPLPIKYCGEGVPKQSDWQVAIGNESGVAYWSYELIQQLFRKLEELQRCCVPCEQNDWIYDGIQGDVYTLLLTDSKYVVRAKFAEDTLPVRIDEFANSPPWKRYARLVWHTTTGNIDGGYVRYSDQVFEAPNAQTLGYSVSFNQGLTMGCYHQESDVVVIPGG